MSANVCFLLIDLGSKEKCKNKKKSVNKQKNLTRKTNIRQYFWSYVFINPDIYIYVYIYIYIGRLFQFFRRTVLDTLK